jgi:hypothetical protein
MLKITKVNIELLTDIEKYNFFELGKRRGISMIAKDMVKLIINILKIIIQIKKIAILCIGMLIICMVGL